MPLSSEDVTVIIPVYCATGISLQWLQECISSAIAAGARNISLYDDGSPMDIKAVISKYKLNHVAFGQQNHGVAYARNRAIEAASTRLILPLDCDDRLAPGAISELVSLWDDVPVYPDIAKFGKVDVPHYVLLDFSCDNVYKYVGFSSVNVLHAKAQWEAVGGYNESLEFYEDGEYNARLFARFCAVRCPKPLVQYRMHDGQRTEQYKTRASHYGKLVMKIISEVPMACSSCGGGRRSKTANYSQNAPIPAPATQDVSSMALMNEQGFVLAQYVGGRGRGKHFYNGPKTGQAYRVTYGIYLYVRPEDARKSSDPAGLSQFVLVQRVDGPQPAAVIIDEAAKVPAKILEKVSPKPEPIIELGEVDDQPLESNPENDVPDVNELTLQEIYELDVPKHVFQAMLSAERKGRNRRKVVDYLQEKAA